MKMMFPRISYLIGEQWLRHSVSDLYMYLQQPQCLSSISQASSLLDLAFTAFFIWLLVLRA